MKAILRTALWQTMGTNAFYHHNTVLLTGAAGSIGSQLVRTLLDANPRGVILTDNNEGALYDLEQDLKSSKVSTFVADVKDKDSMEPLFDGVDFVFPPCWAQERSSVRI